jgi:cyclic beta-1,2-glucan synthetase
MTNRPPSDTATATHQAQANDRGTEGRLEQTARQLAANHIIDPQANGQLHLLERLPAQAKLLHQVHQSYLQSTDEELALSYAAEWVLDNFYLVQQSLRQVEEDLPKTYYKQLPKLNTDSALSGYPRIYDLARELLTYDDCQVDLDRVRRFIHAYQQVHPLTMGELWALPSMLRLALLESLAQATGRITGLFTDVEGLDPALRFRHDIDDPDVVAHSVSSLRRLDNQDWKIFFESVSQVEQVLCDDPVAIYTRMDFNTRDRYRKVVEELALATGLAEVTVAKEAIKLAHSALAANSARDGKVAPMAGEPAWVSLDLSRTGHVGYYLLSKGRSQLEQRIEYQSGWAERLRRWLFDHPTLVYLGSIGLLTLILLFTLLWYALVNNGNLLQLLATGVLVLIPAVTISVSIINQIATHTVPPGILPKLDFEDGIPARCRTMVVIPAMLTDSAEVQSLLNQLELHYLRNPDPNLSFALLTDFADAPGTTSDAVVVGADPDAERAAFAGSATEVGSATRACVRDAVVASLDARYDGGPPTTEGAEHGVVTDENADVREP